MPIISSDAYGGYFADIVTRKIRPKRPELDRKRKIDDLEAENQMEHVAISLKLKALKRQSLL